MVYLAVRVCAVFACKIITKIVYKNKRFLIKKIIKKFKIKYEITKIIKCFSFLTNKIK